MRKLLKYSALFLWVLGIIEVVMIAWFILPGAFRYETINGFGYAADIRTNRFMGATEIHGPGWQKIAFDGKTVILIQQPKVFGSYLSGVPLYTKN